MLVFLRYMKLDMCTEQSLDPDVKASYPQSPYSLVGHSCFVQTSVWAKRGSSIWMNCFGFPLYLGGVGEGGFEREGKGKLCISYWSNAGRMGVLYNVELVNCMRWPQWVTILVLWTECICEMNNNNLQWQVSVYYCLASRRNKVIVCTQMFKTLLTITVSKLKTDDQANEPYS